MKRIGYFNGEIAPIDEMSIPLCDRSVFFGDAVYDAVLVLDKKPFTLDLHLDRLYNSCRLAQIRFDMERTVLEAEISRLLQFADDGSTMLYLQVTRGAAPRKHEFPQNTKANLIMSVTPVSLPSPDKRASLVSFEDKRFVYCNIKTVNLLPNVLAAQKSAECGATEALLHRGERVTEAAHSSILILKDGVLVMPPLDELILPGITRAIITELCNSNDIPVAERIITVDELCAADEILLCSTTKNVIFVYDIDGKAVGGKDQALAQHIQSLFRKKLESETGVLI